MEKVNNCAPIRLYAIHIFIDGCMFLCVLNHIHKYYLPFLCLQLQSPQMRHQRWTARCLLTQSLQRVLAYEGNLLSTACYVFEPKKKIDNTFFYSNTLLRHPQSHTTTPPTGLLQFIGGYKGV